MSEIKVGDLVKIEESYLPYAGCSGTVVAIDEITGDISVCFKDSKSVVYTSGYHLLFDTLYDRPTFKKAVLKDELMRNVREIKDAEFEALKQSVSSLAYERLEKLKLFIETLMELDEVGAASSSG